MFFVFFPFPPSGFLAVGDDLNEKGPHIKSEGKVVAGSQSGVDVIGKCVDKIYGEPNDYNPSSYDEHISVWLGYSSGKYIHTLRNPEEGEYFWLLLDFIESGITSRFYGSLKRRQDEMVDCWLYK